MVKDVAYGKTLRKSFARVEEIQEMPNLLEIQKNSYQWFLDTGLREVFRDVASITDYSGNLELTFIDYSMEEEPKYTIEECIARDATYAAPLKVSVRLRNKETEEIKEQEIFMGDFPLMTPGGTFVINGAERVIVSQIVRSPGMYYDKKTDKAGLSIYSATVIPYRGAWLEYETDVADLFNVRIDKNRKLPVTWLLKAVGCLLYTSPKNASRNGNYITYFKQSEAIEDFLTMMGAPLAAMELMTAKVEKEIRNSINRRVNCDTANLEKMVAASMDQVEAIRRLEASGRLDALPERLKETARLRIENPEASLSELAELAVPRVTKSCLNHRLRKIVELSK